MDLLGKKIIQPSSSEWAAAPVICMKKDGKFAIVWIIENLTLLPIKMRFRCLALNHVLTSYANYLHLLFRYVQRSVEKERKQLGFNTWAEATREVQDRSQWIGLVHCQLSEFNAFCVASYKICFSPRFYTVIKLQKIHSILK